MSSYLSNRGFKTCDVCGGSGHIAKFCSYYSSGKTTYYTPTVVAYPKYYDNKHIHLPYKNMNKPAKSTKVSVIISQFLKVDTNGCDALMVHIEEVAYNNYNQMVGYINKDNCISELNNLKTMLNYKMEQFIACDGVSIISNLIIANSC
jgi:hypothetical protein